MTEQRKAIAYTRVSTSEQAISELSLEAQHREVIIQAKLSDVTIVQRPHRQRRIGIHAEPPRHVPSCSPTSTAVESTP